MKASGTASLWSLVFVPLLIATICLPMALELVGPNTLYGVRIEATRVSEAEWYRINRVSGISGVVAGFAGFLVNLLIARSGMATMRKQWTCLAVLIGVAAVLVATSFAAA